MESFPIPTITFSRTSSSSDNGNPQGGDASKLNLSPSSISVDVKDSASHPKLGLSLNSEEFRIIEQGFAIFLSRCKSLKRVEEKSQSFPRFFTKTTGKIEDEYALSDSNDVPSKTENPRSSKTSPHGSSSKIPEDAVILTSSSSFNNHPPPLPDLFGENSQSRIDPNNTKEAGNSNPDTKSSTTSSCGFCGILDDGYPELPTTDDLQQATPGSTSSLPAGNSHFELSNCKLEDTQQRQRPHTASSIPLSLQRPCRTSVRFGKSYSEARNPFEQLISEKNVNQTNPQSSSRSLEEIESFHQQFVGDLPLLCSPYVKEADDPILEEILHGSIEILESGVQFQNIEQVITEETMAASQPQQYKALSEDKLEKEVKVVEETKVATSTNEVAKLEKTESEIESTTSENQNDYDSSSETCPTTLSSIPSIPSTYSNDAVGKSISTFVTKYVEFMETEWKRRRAIWLESNKYNASSKKTSVYAYETFKDCVAHGKIQLQVPFDLPDVSESNANPVYKDSDDDDELESFKVKDTLEAADYKSSSKIESLSLSQVKSESGEVIKSTNATADAPSVEELNVTPMDLTPFLEGCRDILEYIRNEGCKPSGNKQQETITKDSEEEGHLHVSTVDHEKASGNDVDGNPKATHSKLDKVASSSSSKKSSESIKPKGTKSDKSNSNVTKTAAAAAKSKFNPPKSKLPSKMSKPKKGSATSSSSTVPNKKSPTCTNKATKPEKMQVQFTNENKTRVPPHDPLPNEPLVEIYRGLSRENTMSNLKRNMDENLEYKAFVNGRTFVCESLEQKTRLDICCMKLNTVQSYASNLKDLCTLPGVKILPYLSLFDCMNCRHVSKSWNNAVITSKAFLSDTTFIVSKKPLGALATLEASKVRWQHLRCSVIPAINFSNSSYNGRYHTANLRVTPVSSRREPLTNTLTTVIFENFDIQKQQLVQWIQNCKRLAVVDVRNCNFMKTTTSMNMDKAYKVMERITVMKFSGMDIMKLSEALRFFLPATRRLHTLEILQKRDAKPKSITLTTRRTVEDDVATIICPALLKNSKTLKNILFEMVSVKNFALQSKIVDALGSEIFQLNSLVIRSYCHLEEQPCFKSDSYGSSKSMTGQLRSTLNSSQDMILLDFPMLEIDFVHGEDGSWLLPTKLQKLAAQLEMPKQEEFKTDVEFPNMKELELYGTPLENVQWYHVKQTMKGLTTLTVHCTGIRDAHLQAIIHNLKSLQVICLENTQDVTDYGITGMEKSWIERLKMYWPEKTDTSYEQISKDKIRFVGKSLASLEDLTTFKIKGNFSISNVGILYGFNSRKLTTLELRGSALNVSNSGLFILGFQCSNLQNLHMVVQHSKANQSGIRDLYDALVDKKSDAFSVELLPNEIFGAEGPPGIPMIMA